MGEDSAAADVVDVAGVAELLGVSRRSAARHTARADFPTPIVRPDPTVEPPEWHRDDVLSWQRARIPSESTTAQVTPLPEFFAGLETAVDSSGRAHARRPGSAETLCSHSAAAGQPFTTFLSLEDGCRICRAIARLSTSGEAQARARAERENELRAGMKAAWASYHDGTAEPVLPVRLVRPSRRLLQMMRSP